MRFFWIVWCTCWLVFWLTIGWIVLPILNMVLAFWTLIVMLPACFPIYSDRRL